MFTLRTLSPSSARMYQSCPHQWHRHYVDHETPPSPMVFVRGRALDEACRYLFLRKLAGLETSRAAFVARAGQEHQFSLENEPCVKDKSPAASLADVELAAVAFYDRLADQLHPRSPEDIQRSYRKTLPELGPALLGVVDLVTADGTVVDVKFSSKLKSQKDADEDMQLSTYALLTDLTAVAFAVATPSGEAALVRSTRSQRQMVDTLKTYRRIAADIQAEKFDATPGKFVCQWCGYHGNCRHEMTDGFKTLEELFTER